MDIKKKDFRFINGTLLEYQLKSWRLKKGARPTTNDTLGNGEKFLF